MNMVADGFRRRKKQHVGSLSLSLLYGVRSGSLRFTGTGLFLVDPTASQQKLHFTEVDLCTKVSILI